MDSAEPTGRKELYASSLLGLGMLALMIGGVVGSVGLGLGAPNHFQDTSFRRMAIYGLLVAFFGIILTMCGCHLLCAPVCRKDSIRQTEQPLVSGITSTAGLRLGTGYVQMASVLGSDTLPAKTVDMYREEQKMVLTPQHSNEGRVSPLPQGLGIEADKTVQWGEMWPGTGGGQMWTT